MPNTTEPFITFKRKEAPSNTPKKSSNFKKTMRHAILNGWFSDQHGAWFMAIIAPLFGLFLGHDLPVACTATVTTQPQFTMEQPTSSISTVSTILLCIAWLTAFLDFSALTGWFRSKRNPRYRNAIIIYTGLTAILGGAVLALNPNFIYWLIVFVPLFGLAAPLTWLGYERAFITRISAITASMMMVPAVAFVYSGRALTSCDTWGSIFLTDVSRVWTVTAGLLMYYIASVPYVKTLVRRRGSVPWLVFSIGLHVVFLGITLWGWWNSMYTFVSAIVWVILLARAIYMPYKSHKMGRPIKPRDIGFWEVYFSIFVFVGLYQSITCGCLS